MEVEKGEILDIGSIARALLNQKGDEQREEENWRKLVESIEATIWYLERLSVGGRYQTIRDLARVPNKTKMKGIEIARFAASVGRWKTDIKVSIGTRR